MHAGRLTDRRHLVVQQPAHQEQWSNGWKQSRPGASTQADQSCKRTLCSHQDGRARMSKRPQRQVTEDRGVTPTSCRWQASTVAQRKGQQGDRQGIGCQVLDTYADQAIQAATHLHHMCAPSVCVSHMELPGKAGQQELH